MRIKTATADSTAELTDLIEEARRDMESLGVLVAKTTDETDALILGAIRCFVRWKMAQTPEDAAADHDNYMTSRDELRHKSAYTEAVTA